MTDISGSNTVSDGYNKPYTPTTEMVKSLYEIGKIKAYDSYDLAEFDRWLAEVKAEAWEESLR